MFSAFAGVYRCRSGPESRKKSRKGSAVLEITEKNSNVPADCYMQDMSTVFLSFLDNCWPLSSTVSSSWFWTDSTPANTCKGRKHSAARIRVGDFERCSPLAVFFHFLGNFRLSLQPKILFEICFVILDRFDTSKQLLEAKKFCRAIQGCQIWIWMKTGSMRGIFIRKFLYIGEDFSVENSTFIIYFRMLNKVGLIQCAWIVSSIAIFCKIRIVTTILSIADWHSDREL